jgi:methionine-rich copper-binding protein CopC
MRRCYAVLSLTALACACGPTDADGDGIADGIRTPDNVSLVAPSTPQGSISGHVLTTRFTPLAGAQVTLSVGAPGEGGPRTTQSDAGGAFHFDKVPAGAQVLVTLSKEGFGTARQTVTVPSSAGNFPINHGNAVVGPFALTELNGSLKLQIITHSGRPAKGARAQVQASPAAVLLSESGTFGPGQGAVVVEATADDAGLLTFTGLPGAVELARLTGRYDVHVQPIDEDGDGIFDSAGRFVTYTAQLIATDPSPRLVQLEDARAPGAVQLLATNVASLKSAGSPPNQNFLKAGEAVHLVFNQAITTSGLVVQLTDELAKQSLSVAATVADPGNVLVLTPSSTIEPGREYNLRVRVTSQDSGTQLQATGYFFGGEVGSPITAALHSIQYRDEVTDGQLSLGEHVFVRLTVPVGQAQNGGGLQAFFNYDLDGSGNISDSIGELGNASGFPVSLDEPTGTGTGDLFPVVPSGYTTRLRFQYFGSATVPNQASVHVAFDKTPSYGAYQTLWGEALTKGFTAGITAAQ